MHSAVIVLWCARGGKNRKEIIQNSIESWICNLVGLEKVLFSVLAVGKVRFAKMAKVRKKLTRCYESA